MSPIGDDIGAPLPSSEDVLEDIVVLEKIAHELHVDIQRHTDSIRRLISRQVELGRIDDHGTLPYGTAIRVLEILEGITKELRERVVIDEIWH